MKQIVISEVFSAAWELTKRHWAVVLACVVLSYVINQLFGTLMGPSALDTMQFMQDMQNNPDQFDPINFMNFYTKALRGNIVGSIFVIIFTTGVLKMILDLTRGTRSEFSLDVWKMPFNTYLHFVLTSLVTSFIVTIGFAFCIIPGIYLLARLQFATYYVVDRNATIGEAISASWNRTSDQGVTLSLILVCKFLCGLVGMLCCCVGVVVAEIINHFVNTVCYTSLMDNPNAETTEIPAQVSAEGTYNKSEK